MIQRKPGPTLVTKLQPLTKLFVLDTNVLMHDPTSLFRFEEHDMYLPMFTLEELDYNKKGMSEVARNARQASRFLDEIVTKAAEDIRRHSAGKCRCQGGDRPPVPADRGDHGRTAGTSGSRQGGQPDPRRGHAPA